MSKLYGKTTKFIRHVRDTTYTVGPQRAMLIPFWYAKSDETRTDGQDKSDTFGMPLGSVITKHKVETLVTPYTVEPQKLYMARLKLSFHDVLSPQVCGITIDQPSYQGTVTKADVTSFLQFYPDEDTKRAVHPSAEFDISGIDTLKLDDRIHHFLGKLSKTVVFDQRPLMGDKWQRIPAKAKRINDFTWYGMFVFNDSPRGATPADTNLDINLKEYLEEWAL